MLYRPASNRIDSRQEDPRMSLFVNSLTRNGRPVKPEEADRIQPSRHHRPAYAFCYFFVRAIRPFGNLYAVICLLFVVPPAMMWHSARAFVAAPSAHPPCVPSAPNRVARTDNSVRVAVIGDSWACGRGMADALEKALAGAGVIASVTSFGHGGAKSREVLLDLLKPLNQTYSSRAVLEAGRLHHMS